MRPARQLITPTSLADEIAFRLESEILEGVYPPGTHLLQDELSERFGVSRTPIREALRKLQAQHLVVLVPNKGATVRVPSRQELIDVYLVRAELEGFACELAAHAVTDEVLAKMDQAQAALEDAVVRIEQGSIQAADEAAVNSQVARSNQEFHATIHRAAANNRLSAIIEDLQGFFPKDYVWRALHSGDEIRALNIEEHQRLRDALAARNGKRARREMQEHILHASSILVSYLDDHDFWR